MQLSILINAYACSPNMGSEPGMAWNWCVNLAKYCELHIITEGEFRDKIEAILLPFHKEKICISIIILFQKKYGRCAGTREIGVFISTIKNGNGKLT